MEIHESLIYLESSLQKFYLAAPYKNRVEDDDQEGVVDRITPVLGVDSKKINSVKKIMDIFSGQSCYMSQIPSPPFADNHGPNDLFESAPAAGEALRFDSILMDAAADYGMDLSPTALSESEKQLEIESQTILGDWEYSLTVEKRLSETFQEHRSKDTL